MTLRVTPEDAPRLERTRAAFAAACDWLSGVAYREHEFNMVRLHRRAYAELRARFGLPADYAIRVLHVVADSYRGKGRQETRHRFLPDAAVVLNDRLYRFEPKGGYQRVSLSTVDGRITCGLAIGGYQRAVLARATKTTEADLFRDGRGRWRLHLAVVLPDPTRPTSPPGCWAWTWGSRTWPWTATGRPYSGRARERAAPPLPPAAPEAPAQAHPQRPQAPAAPGGASRRGSSATSTTRWRSAWWPPPSPPTARSQSKT